MEKKDELVKYFNNYKKNTFFGEIFIDFKELAKIRRKKIIAFAGIAHPKNFFNLLDNQNINLIDTISFPDHYRYKKNDIEKLAERTLEKFDNKLDILINNAALFTAAPITDIDRDDYLNVFSVNVSGVLFTMQAVARHMIGRGNGG